MVSITVFSLLSFALATWVSFWTWAPQLQSSNKLAPANINLILFILLYLNNGFCKTTKTFGLSMR
ncbi:hypothetical protein BACUNI_04037 [Bacteroides uniformis ATCC 8492]|uniref:Uncharacterized protein n=1 Tax=Bacteroides uniformis (strain ATCC 8492 / DSM 6597 / CCUG 4942 / CIP 103695 / JCM 5828 / KCTC 5204 / NCTC 13054 / VPI 0061) TaxID=411479 RepID=A0ABC9N6U2_BACUC|nr:hypothetical protein BACUNI_04037 [Bacteroides uniformis ATCC 8492]